MKTYKGLHNQFRYHSSKRRVILPYKNHSQATNMYSIRRSLQRLIWIEKTQNIQKQQSVSTDFIQIHQSKTRPPNQTLETTPEHTSSNQ